MRAESLLRYPCLLWSFGMTAPLARGLPAPGFGSCCPGPGWSADSSFFGFFSVPMIACLGLPYKESNEVRSCMFSACTCSLSSEYKKKMHLSQSTYEFARIPCSLEVRETWLDILLLYTRELIVRSGAFILSDRFRKRMDIFK